MVGTRTGTLISGTGSSSNDLSGCNDREPFDSIQSINSDFLSCEYPVIPRSFARNLNSLTVGIFIITYIFYSL